jgi:hypothetical protein
MNPKVFPSGKLIKERIPFSFAAFVATVNTGAISSATNLGFFS